MFYEMKFVAPRLLLIWLGKFLKKSVVSCLFIPNSVYIVEFLQKCDQKNVAVDLFQNYTQNFSEFWSLKILIGVENSNTNS